MKKNYGMIILAVLMSAQGVFAITGTEIAEKAHNIDSAESTHAAVQMDLVSKNGNVDTRLIEQWGSEKNDLASSVMVFRSPATVANTRFLHMENADRDDDKWIYLPALKRVRRIASSEGGSSFMGTDFTYDDMESRDVERDTHELLREEKVRDWNCYVVKGQAKDANDSQYSYRITWFDKISWVPVKVEMYDKSGNLEKVLEIKALEQVSGFWTPMNVELKNVQTGHSTRLSFKKLVYNEEINPKLFTTQFLANGK